MTDNFQVLESRSTVTIETIKLLNERKIRYLIVTKSPTISYSNYYKVLDKDLAHIQITVTCLDDKISRQYEIAPSPSKRIKAIQDLQGDGFDVALRLSPLMEELMDFDKLNSLKIDKTIIEFLRISSWIKDWCVKHLNYDKYTLNSKNYKHLQLEDKIRILNKITLPNISICEKVPEHYDYWMKNFNPNPKDCCNLRIN